VSQSSDARALTSLLETKFQDPNVPAEPRRRLSPAAQRRDRILEAIAASAKELLHASDLAAALPKVVEQVGQAARVDRLHILLLETRTKNAEDRHIEQIHTWSAPGIAPPPSVFGAGARAADIGLGSWAASFAAGKIISGPIGKFDASARRYLESSGVKSVLTVPIMVDGELSGLIGCSNCRVERDWEPSEIDTFQILAELVAEAVVSQRRTRVLRDANRIVESSPTVVFRLGPQPPFPLVFVSHNIRRYGYEAEALMADSGRWPHLLHPDDLAVALANIGEMAAGTRASDCLEFRFKRPDDTWVWFVAETVPLYDDNGRLISIEGILTDITERRQAAQELAASHGLLRAAIENSPEAILVVDQTGRITTFNRHFADLWHIPEQVIIARPDDTVLDRIAACVVNGEEFIAGVRALRALPHRGTDDEVETLDGRVIERHSAPLYELDGQYLGRIWFFRDITVRKRAERTITELARTDSLTGLANRVVFLDRLRLAFARANRRAAPFAVLYLDLDHFKDVNDTLGHPAGDALLREVANRLKDCVRGTDLVARFGGDEFAVLQEDVADAAAAEVLADKICKAIAAPLTIDGNQIHTSASIGIVPYDRDIGDPEAMMSKADLALYRAKSDGRDRFRFHIRELDDRVQERVAIGEGLRNAIDRSELALYYQPQVELMSGQVVALEALLRWNHPSRGLLLPESFIAIAESNGSILQIGQWVLEQVCCQIAQWQKEGIAPPQVAANISAGQFKLATDVDQVVATALRKYGVAAERLELELTESVLMEATQRHNDEFERLRRLGIRLAIDDFGTGYSSFEYLRSFRVARLKIDRRFVGGITVNNDDAKIVRAIIGLGRAFGLDIVAEGVETAEQRAFLVAAGCRFAQGYYFGRPLPADAATRLLRHRARALDSPAQIIG
jgi:diguanylate cyclase (GGDEF)-like protein/PAS domain S-box-containing protein